MKTGEQVNEKGHPTVGWKGSRSIRRFHKDLTKRAIRRQAKAATKDENAPSTPVKTKGWCY